MLAKYVAAYNSSRFGAWKNKFVEPGRNRPCLCGSGKKWKRCYLDKVNAPMVRAVIEAGKKTEEINKPYVFPGKDKTK